MKVKLIVYLVVTILVIIGLDSININNIFKKNKVFQARLFYLLLITSLVNLHQFKKMYKTSLIGKTFNEVILCLEKSLDHLLYQVFMFY